MQAYQRAGSFKLIRIKAGRRRFGILHLHQGEGP